MLKIILDTNFEYIFFLQGTTCYKLLVTDKPGWLSPRLMQRIIDRASQAKKEAQAEQERTYQKCFKNLRNDKVKSKIINNNTFLSNFYLKTGDKILAICRKSLFTILHVWEHFSMFLELLC